VLEVYQGVSLQPAAFLSLHLPPTLDALVPPTFTRQARPPLALGSAGGAVLRVTGRPADVRARMRRWEFRTQKLVYYI